LIHQCGETEWMKMKMKIMKMNWAQTTKINRYTDRNAGMETSLNRTEATYAGSRLKSAHTHFLTFLQKKCECV
jgi:hypothetical protein